MKFENIEVTTLEQVMISTRGSITHAASKLSMGRSTLRKHLKTPDNVIIMLVDGKLKPFICDRRTGHHKKAN